MGSSPSVDLFVTKASVNNTKQVFLSLAEVHIGWNGLIDYLEPECGLAIPHPYGLVIDGWPIDLHDSVLVV